MTNVPEQVKVKSLYKAVRLLDYFTDEHPQRGVTELSAVSGMPKSVVYNMLATFEACGFVQKDPVSNQYALGLKFLELGYRVNKANQQVGNSHQHLQQLADESGETAFLAHRYGYKIMYRDVAYPASQINPHLLGGWTAYMHCSALGKMLLAYEPMDFIVDLEREEGLPGFTETTITTLDGLYRELRRIREQGYSIDNMEQEYGFKCVACPVLDINQRAVAAVSVSGPSLRFGEEDIQRYIKLLRAAAAKMKFL